MDGLFNVILLISSVFLVIEGSAVANKSGKSCKHAVASIEADVTANNLMKIKWKIELHIYCPINNLEVKVFEKHSKTCLVQLVLYIRKEITKTVETNNCNERRNVRVKSLVSGEHEEYWPHSSVRVEGVVMTSIGNFDLTDATLIDPQEAVEWEKKATTCYTDCWKSGSSKPYNGIRTTDKKGNPCQKWSETSWNGIARMCKMDKKPWCVSMSNKAECYVPDCAKKSYSEDQCLKSVTSYSTGTSITGKFDFRYGRELFLVLLFNNKTQLCVDYTIPTNTKRFYSDHVNIKSFIAACPRGQTVSIPTEFTFTNLTYRTNYKIYIIPIDQSRDHMGSYYFHKTKPKKTQSVTIFNVNTVTSSSFNVSWKTPENSFVISYSIINHQTKKKKMTMAKSVAFYELKACTKYCITVTANNDFGSVDSKQFCVITYAKTEGKITLGKINNGSDVSRNISWSHSTENCVDRYKIEYWPKNKKWDHGKEKYTNETFFNLDDLSLYTSYRIQVQAQLSRTNIGNVNVSSIIRSFRTGTPEKPARVTRVTVTPASSSILNINWKAPEDSKVDKYVISLKKENREIRTENTEKKLRVKFNKLKQCTKYCVTVTAMNIGGTSPVSEDFCRKTFASGGGKITLGKIRNDPRQYKNISWSHSAENCVEKYRIIYWPKNKGYNARKEKHTKKTFFYLDDLLPNTQYKIQVEAVVPQTEYDELTVMSHIVTIKKPINSGRAQGAKNILLITVLCVLVAFIAK